MNGGNETMTQKQILKMAGNEEIWWRMQEIAEIQANMCHKTIYERKTATRKMKDYAKEIIEILNSNEETED